MFNNNEKLFNYKNKLKYFNVIKNFILLILTILIIIIVKEMGF